MFGGIEHSRLLAAPTRNDALREPGEPGVKAKVDARMPQAMSKKLKLALLEESIVRAEHCGITTMPPEILQKTRARELTLSRNAITTIPPEIGGLLGLRVLRLDRNAIEAIPPEICGLVNLQVLDLQVNAINAVPVELGLLLHLQVVNLFDNLLADHVPWGADEDGANGAGGSDDGAVVQGPQQGTFFDVYFGPGGSAQTTLAAHTRDAQLRRSTRMLLGALRAHLPRGGLNEQVQQQLAELARADAAGKLRKAIAVADVLRVQECVRAAQDAGLEGPDMDLGHVALKLLAELRHATAANDAATIKAAVEAWDTFVKPGRGEGPDYTNARAAYKRLQRASLTSGWRASENGAGGDGTAGCRARIMSAPPRTAATGASQELGREASVLHRRAVEQRKSQLRAVGARTFERWLEEKQQQELQGQIDLEMYKRQSLQEMVKAKMLKDAEIARSRDLEKAWPSRLTSAYVHGSFTNAGRMLDVRKAYSRPGSAATASLQLQDGESQLWSGGGSGPHHGMGRDQGPQESRPGSAAASLHHSGSTLLRSRHASPLRASTAHPASRSGASAGSSVGGRLSPRQSQHHSAYVNSAPAASSRSRAYNNASPPQGSAQSSHRIGSARGSIASPAQHALSCKALGYSDSAPGTPGGTTAAPGAGAEWVLEAPPIPRVLQAVYGPGAAATGGVGGWQAGGADAMQAPGAAGEGLHLARPLTSYAKVRTSNSGADSAPKLRGDQNHHLMQHEVQPPNGVEGFGGFAAPSGSSTGAAVGDALSEGAAAARRASHSSVGAWQLPAHAHVPLEVNFGMAPTELLETTVAPKPSVSEYSLGQALLSRGGTDTSSEAGQPSHRTIDQGHHDDGDSAAVEGATDEVGHEDEQQQQQQERPNHHQAEVDGEGDETAMAEAEGNELPDGRYGLGPPQKAAEEGAVHDAEESAQHGAAGTSAGSEERDELAGEHSSAPGLHESLADADGEQLERTGLRVGVQEDEAQGSEGGEPAGASSTTDGRESHAGAADEHGYVRAGAVVGGVDGEDDEAGQAAFDTQSGGDSVPADEEDEAAAEEEPTAAEDQEEEPAAGEAEAAEEDTGEEETAGDYADDDAALMEQALALADEED